ncbi:MAG TPA: type IV pilus modification protein PilV [Frateuria sp.]|uniref:type IV pilus modification protein PilV n=1 Tax=Frateuria sp. TaxID=2211372 RepID=UPI002D7FA7BF|nr:type IV pilus modification protein PilV [Frateuria sp.]HET6805377.1 type IV pilus modification protein PilV [Frateuria sp.]
MPGRGRPRPGAQPNGRRQAGVGLIEVMVAMLILSIGFLGVAALLATSLSTNNSAMARSMATVSSYSILDAMRADLANARGGSYNATVTASKCSAVAATGLPGAQLKVWCGQLGQNLGALDSTKGTIACNAAGTSSADCQVTVTFDDSRSGEGGSDQQQIVTRAML